MNTMLLTESSSRVSMSTRETLKGVLQFLAETINLYNWYLRRSANPRHQVYDETEEVMYKLYEELYKRAKEDPEVSRNLNTAGWIFSLDPLQYDAGVLEEEFDANYIDHNNARLWCYFVQRRQRELSRVNMMSMSDDDSTAERECEQMIWSEVDGTTDTPELYARLLLLENEYVEMLTYGNGNIPVLTNDGTTPSTLIASLYNIVEWDAGTFVQLHELIPPAFGLANVELERVYLRHPEHMEGMNMEEYNDQHDDYDYLTPTIFSSLLVRGKEVVCQFECPLCYEEQCSGSPGVRTACDHAYCESCFWRMVSQKRECGMCRSSISEIVELIVV